MYHFPFHVLILNGDFKNTYKREGGNKQTMQKTKGLQQKSY